MWTYNYPDYLEHHGILGMKWGRRNGPPYPLISSNRTAVEKRENKSISSSSDSRNKKNALQKAIDVLSRKKTNKAKSNVSEPQPAEKKRTVKDLTDSELRERIQRMELEMKYSELVRRMNPKKESRIKKVVYNILERSATDLGTQALKYAGGQTINKMAGKKVINSNNEKKKDNK